MRSSGEMTADFPFICDECRMRRAELNDDDGWEKRRIGNGRGSMVKYLCPDCQDD